jgi:DNA-directed RNA polymerase subunit omega
MMIEPGIDKLKKRADSRYSLVVAVAKRARDLSVEGVKPFVEVESGYEKAVSTAVKEVAGGYIRIIAADDEPFSGDDVTYTEYIEPSEEEGEES